MSEISNTNVSNNGLNKALVCNKGLSPSICPVVRTFWSSLHEATVREMLSTQDNISVMTYYYQNHLRLRRYKQWFHAFCIKKFKVRVQRLWDQVRMIQQKGWLSQRQLEESGNMMLKFYKESKTEEALNLYNR